MPSSPSHTTGGARIPSISSKAKSSRSSKQTTGTETTSSTQDSMTLIPSMEGKTRGVIHQPTAFVKFWLLVSSIIVIWDFSFIFLRRWSLTSQGGVLAALWPGYDLYEFVDLNYSAKYWLDNRGFPLAQSTLNVMEDILNFSYLYLVHQSDPAYRAIAPIVGFSGVLMTFSKTLLYFLCDYYCGWCESGHNDWSTWIFLYAVSMVSHCTYRHDHVSDLPRP